MRLLRARPSLVDGVLAVGLGVLAQVMVWSGRMKLEHYVEGQPPQFREMGPGEAFHVTPGLRHRMVAIEDTDVFEVSTTELDDVVRLEDAYGREGTSKA